MGLMFHVVLHRQVDKKEEIGNVCKGGVVERTKSFFIEIHYWSSDVFRRTLLVRTFVYAMVGFFIINISPLQAHVRAFLSHSLTDFI